MLRISGKVAYRIKVTLSGKGLANFISSRQCPFLLVRIDHQNVQAITFRIVVSVNVNVLHEGDQCSVAVYVLIGLVVGA